MKIFLATDGTQMEHRWESRSRPVADLSTQRHDFAVGALKERCIPAQGNALGHIPSHDESPVLSRPPRGDAPGWFTADLQSAISSVFHLCSICGLKNFFLLWLLLVSAWTVVAQPAPEFEAANKLFEQGKFAEAAAGYERLLTNGPTAALHFNLANARFKSGQPGKAIFHYQQALRLAPRDPDARGNLQFARRSLGVTVEENMGHRLLRRHTLDEWAWLAGGGLGAWFLLLALGEALPVRRDAFAGLTKSVGVLALVLTALLGVAHWERSAARQAVVVVGEAPVRPGPLAESKAAFAFRDGTEVTVLDAKDDWLQVRDAGQRVGWVRRDALWELPRAEFPI